MSEPTIILALALVLASAFAHATWNLLLKRAQRQEVFVWWLSAFAVVGAAPIAVLLALLTDFEPVGWWYVIATSLVHICYFLFLGRSLARADLSLAYPIARGFGPGLVPVLAVFALGEAVTVPAWVGIGAIVVGIYTMSWLRQLRRPFGAGFGVSRSGIIYALLTGLCIALYTLVDKQGVAYVSPFLYLYLMTCGVAIGMLPYIIRTYSVTALAEEWRTGYIPVMAASALLFLAYGLVLTAMSFTNVSYVAPAREVGLLFALMLGAVVLKERVTSGRLIGAGLIVAGLVLITAFR
ncbi:MAG: EamA family transporter [Dehalococcoidia bacterium]|nr:EamA family transporter [Dehalococcoidia bacterium]